MAVAGTAGAGVTEAPWIEQRDRLRRIDGPTATYSREDLAGLDRDIHYFGDHVAFDKAKWYRDGR